MVATTPQKAAWTRTRLDQLGRRFGAWALGFGLVGLHVAVFLVVATGLILLDLYRSPDQLTVDDNLRTWGSIVALHALAVTVFQIVRWAIHEEQIEAVADPLPAMPQTSYAVITPVHDPLAIGTTSGSWWRDLPARWRTLMEPQQATVTTATMAAPSANGHVSNGAHGWPAAHTQSLTNQPGAWPARPADAAPSINGHLDLNGADRTAPDPARWSWVEAAAAAWLTPREPDSPRPTDQSRHLDRPYTPAENSTPALPPSDESDRPPPSA
jgi:hypothetical protein